MVMFVLERVPVSVRGDLTRWLLEIKAGVFLGTVSAEVRDRLWERVTGALTRGAAYLVYPAQNEQHFVIRSHGETARQVRDFDGLQLLTVPDRESAGSRPAGALEV